MKFCPYCGASLIDSTVLFCSECGKKLQFKEKSIKIQKPNKSVNKKNKSAYRKRTVQGKKEAADQTKDENYDGYYDDIAPEDEGVSGEGRDLELIKRIGMIIFAATALIVLSVVFIQLL